MIVHWWTRLHLQTMLRLRIVHRLIQHPIWSQMIWLVIHVGHLMVVHHWRLNRILLMILVADRLLWDRRRINHVGHRCVLPLLLVLQMKSHRIYTIYSHHCCEGRKESKKKRKAKERKKMGKRSERWQQEEASHTQKCGKRKKKEGETARTSLFCGK